MHELAVNWLELHLVVADDRTENIAIDSDDVSLVASPPRIFIRAAIPSTNC